MSNGIRGLFEDPVFLMGLNTLAASPGTRGLTPLGMAGQATFQQLGQLQERAGKQEQRDMMRQQRELQKQQMEAQMQRQQAMQQFGQQMSEQVGQGIPIEQVVMQGLAAGAFEPKDAIQILRQQQQQQKPMYVGPGGAVFDPTTGKKLFEQPAARGAGGGSGFPKPPAHFRWTESGELEPIPGGREDYKRKENIAGLEQALNVTRELKGIAGGAPGGYFSSVVGPRGMITRYGELGAELVPGMEGRPTPATDFRNKQEWLKAHVRKMFDSGVLSNQDMARIDRAIGAGNWTTEDAAKKALERTEREIAEIIQKKSGVVQDAPAAEKKSGVPEGMPSPSENKGRIIFDRETGARYRSDGGKWVHIQ